MMITKGKTRKISRGLSYPWMRTTLVALFVNWLVMPYGLVRITVAIVIAIAGVGIAALVGDR